MKETNEFRRVGRDLHPVRLVISMKDAGITGEQLKSYIFENFGAEVALEKLVNKEGTLMTPYIATLISDLLSVIKEDWGFFEAMVKFHQFAKSKTPLVMRGVTWYSENDGIVPFQEGNYAWEDPLLKQARYN